MILWQKQKQQQQNEECRKKQFFFFPSVPAWRYPGTSKEIQFMLILKNVTIVTKNITYIS